MNMSPEQEEFKDLRRLLALKRHEKPPPGYFHHFSDQVIAGISSGERGESPSFLERIFSETVWLQRFWASLERKPALAGAFGTAVCLILVLGIIYSGRLDSPQGYAEIPLVTPVGLAQESTRAHPLAQPVTVSASLSSTAPLANTPAGGSLFDEIRRVQPLEATYQTMSFGGH